MARYPKASLPSETGRGLRRATWISPKAMSLGAGGSNIFD